MINTTLYGSVLFTNTTYKCNFWLRIRIPIRFLANSLLLIPCFSSATVSQPVPSGLSWESGSIRPIRILYKYLLINPVLIYPISVTAIPLALLGNKWGSFFLSLENWRLMNLWWTIHAQQNSGGGLAKGGHGRILFRHPRPPQFTGGFFVPEFCWWSGA